MEDHRQGSAYEGLYGADFIEKARENRDAAAFEAIWRLRQAAAARTVVEPLASLSVPKLSDLLLQEALEADIGPEVGADIQAAVRQHFPPLTPDGVRRLAAWLRENTVPQGGYTAAREVLETWLVRQEGSDSDSFTLDALTDELGYQVGEDCRRAAVERCGENANLAQRVTTRFEAALAEDADPDAWDLAADFVGAMAADRRPPGYLEPLTDRLLAGASELDRAEEFSRELQAAMVALSAPTLKKLLAGEPLSDSPGSRALVRLHGDLKRPQERAKAFIDALHEQSRVWRQIGPSVMQSWDTNEWPAAGLRPAVGSSIRKRPARWADERRPVRECGPIAADRCRSR